MTNYINGVPVGQSLIAMSIWLDNHNAHKPRELQMWERCGKVAEEAGEVVGALIGILGQNPRKGVTHTKADLVGELLDVAVTALGAVEHLTGNNGAALSMLAGKVQQVVDRAGLVIPSMAGDIRAG